MKKRYIENKVNRKKDIEVLLRYNKSNRFNGFIEGASMYYFTNGYHLLALKDSYDIKECDVKLSEDALQNHLEGNKDNDYLYFSCIGEMLESGFYIDKVGTNRMLKYENNKDYCINVKYLNKMLDIMKNGAREIKIKVDMNTLFVYVVNDNLESGLLLSMRVDYRK